MEGQLAGELDVNQDLTAQQSIQSYMFARALEASRFTPGAADDGAFAYASAVYDETKAKVAKLTGGGEAPLRATGDGLRAYLEQLKNERGAEDRNSITVFRDQMAALLADRLDGSPDGLVPRGYVLASQLLRYDCEVTGVNGYTGEPMPEMLTNQPPAMYGIFFNMETIVLARHAFGDEFADEVVAIYRDMTKDLKAKAGVQTEEEVAPFGGGRNTLGNVEEATDAYQAAGRWWAHAVLEGSFDNGADDPLNQQAQNMARVMSKSAEPELEDKIGGFAKALEHLLRKDEIRSVGVDYHPAQVLRDAADLAGMPFNEMMTFPWKTNMWIENGVVRVSAGYGQPIEQVWPPVSPAA